MRTLESSETSHSRKKFIYQALAIALKKKIKTFSGMENYVTKQSLFLNQSLMLGTLDCTGFAL